MNRHLISALITFTSMFLVSLGGSIITVGDAQWTGALVLSLIVAAARFAVKGVIETATNKAL